MAILAVAISAHVIFFFAGDIPISTVGFERYFGLQLLFTPIAFIALTLLFLARRRREPLFAVMAIGLAAVVWTPAVNLFSSNEQRAKAEAYLNVQRWARDNSPPKSIFMIDPAHAYGWREFSHRASFGSVREWLYAGWAYNTKAEIYTEGVARFEGFGLKLDDYLALEAEEPRRGRSRLVRNLRHHYYRATASWYEEMARQYGIEYYVFDKTYIRSIIPLTVIFENENYLVMVLLSNNN